MALSYKARRRWSLVVLLIALPAYIAAVLFVVSLFDRPPFLLELAIYVGLGIVWVLPLKRIFIGIGQADPDAPTDPRNDEDAS
jgi:predicted membrane channel-forming protein YqfA (hemolysin III family)